MKMSEYAAQHKTDGQKLEVKQTVSATTLVGEIITIEDYVRIEKTKFGSAAYMVKLPDGTGFFTTSSLTRQIDKWLGAGVETLKGCRFVITKNTLPAEGDKPERTFLQFEYLDDGEE